MDRDPLMRSLAVARAALRAIKDFDEEGLLGDHLENAEQELMRARAKLLGRPTGSPTSSTPRAS